MRLRGALLATMLGLLGTLRADFEMGATMAVTLPSISGPISLTNRQGTSYLQAGWNNDFFEIVALGFDSTSVFSTPIGALTLLGGTDMDGGTQYRWALPKGTINLKPPYAADSSVIATNNPRWAIGSANATSGGTMPFPRYPHAVLRGSPSWGPKYPDTRTWAPALSSAAIGAASGAVTAQADYYSPAAWAANDSAPLFASAATQHPTQLWLGRLNYGPGGTEPNAIDDAVAGADFAGFTMRSSGATGLRWAPNSPTGTGVAYTHSSGSGPGGLMWAMSAAYAQELFGYDMRLIMALGSQECGMGIFYNGSAGNPDWNWAADACADGAGDGRYQMINADKQQAIMAFPDLWPHPNSYLDAPLIGPASGLVSETVAMALDLSSRYYGYFSPSRNLRLDEFASGAADPWALTRMVTYGYNQGPHVGNIWALACGTAARTAAQASNNISVTHGIVGAFGYAPQIVDVQRRIGRSGDVYDWGITWGDVQDFLADLRAVHYANGIPSNADWASMTTDLQAAFVKMQGKAPTAGLTGTQISFRYNWLTMLRIMKNWLPNPHQMLAKGHVNNQNDFYQTYLATAEETGAMCGTQNLAPEVYWVSPHYPSPTLAQAFPAIGGDGTVCLDKGVTVTAEVLDDYVGYGNSSGMRVRWALSPGDPAAGNYSLWRDGNLTGGAPMAPVATDWALMADVGASSTPGGGRRYQALIPTSTLAAAGTKRLYIQADDGNGYKTVSWVDLAIEDCSLATPTPTPCVPDLGLPAGHGPISCFPSAAAVASVSLGAAGGALSWVAGPGATSDTVGALKYTRSGGSLYYGKLFRLPVPEGSLTGYNQICIKIWNQTGAASPPLQLVSGSGPTILSTAPQTVGSSSGYVTYCWDLQNQGAADIATSGVELFVNTGGNPVTNGDYLFDEITLRTTGSVVQSDPRCCPSSPPSPTPTVTPTPSPSATRSATPTATRSPSPSPSSSPSPTPTASPSASPTATGTATPSASPTPFSSPTHTPSATVTLTSSPSASPSATRSASPSGTPSPSSTATRSATPTASLTYTCTWTDSPTALGTFTESPSSTATRTVTPTATPTPSFTVTPSRTVTPSATPSATPSQTYSATPTRSATPTETCTRTPTPTATPSRTFSATPTLSPSFTETPTFTVSPTISPTTDRFYQQDSLIKVRGLYPNPFSDRLKVYYTLRVQADVKMTVYNVAGEPIWKVAVGGKAGKNLLEWAGENEGGSHCASGAYILHLEARGIDGSEDGFWERAAISR